MVALKTRTMPRMKVSTRRLNPLQIPIATAPRTPPTLMTAVRSPSVTSLSVRASRYGVVRAYTLLTKKLNSEPNVIRINKGRRAHRKPRPVRHSFSID